MSVSMRPKRRFSQNFLADPAISHRIVECATLDPNDFVLEIGCGQGALTHALIERVQPIHGIEADADLIPVLKKTFASQLILHCGDVLTFRVADLSDGRPVRVVGNLPYHITSPILFWLLDQRDTLTDATIMVQKEVADRIVAAPGNKDYGILSVLCGFFAECRKCFVVPAGAFHPKPKVDSAVLRMTFRAYPIQPARVDRFREIVRRSFQQRRKMLRNSLAAYDLSRTTIQLTRRPETLSIDEFIQLSNELSA